MLYVRGNPRTSIRMCTKYHDLNFLLEVRRLTLINAHIPSNGRGCYAINFAQFPFELHSDYGQITRLAVYLRGSFSRLVSVLPSTLVKLRVKMLLLPPFHNETHTSGTDLLRYCTNLRSLNLDVNVASMVENLTRPYSLDNLPDSLTELTVGGLFTGFDYLPSQLSRLTITCGSQFWDHSPEMRHPLIIDHLPRNLRFLAIHKRFPGHLDNLPPSLLHLVLHEVPTVPPLDHLPSGLVTLSMSMCKNRFSDPQHLHHNSPDSPSLMYLPQCLQTLSINTTAAIQNTKFPPTLLHLSLAASKIYKLSELPSSLQFLRISCNELIGTMPSIPPSVIDLRFNTNFVTTHPALHTLHVSVTNNFSNPTAPVNLAGMKHVRLSNSSTNTKLILISSFPLPNELFWHRIYFYNFDSITRLELVGAASMYRIDSFPNALRVLKLHGDIATHLDIVPPSSAPPSSPNYCNIFIKQRWFTLPTSMTKISITPASSLCKHAVITPEGSHRMLHYIRQTGLIKKCGKLPKEARCDCCWSSSPIKKLVIKCNNGV